MVALSLGQREACTVMMKGHSVGKENVLKLIVVLEYITEYTKNY